jgi:hypothetical protein
VPVSSVFCQTSKSRISVPLIFKLIFDWLIEAFENESGWVTGSAYPSPGKHPTVGIGSVHDLSCCHFQCVKEVMSRVKSGSVAAEPIASSKVEILIERYD